MGVSKRRRRDTDATKKEKMSDTGQRKNTTHLKHSNELTFNVSLDRFHWKDIFRVAEEIIKS